MRLALRAYRAALKRARHEQALNRATMSPRAVLQAYINVNEPTGSSRISKTYSRHRAKAGVTHRIRTYSQQQPGLQHLHRFPRRSTTRTRFMRRVAQHLCRDSTNSSFQSSTPGIQQPCLPPIERGTSGGTGSSCQLCLVHHVLVLSIIDYASLHTAYKYSAARGQVDANPSSVLVCA